MKRTKEYRRSVAKTHISRKKNLSKDIYHFDWYDHDNQYSKNKIHCSCWMCAARDAYYEWLKFHGMNDLYKEELLDSGLNPVVPNRTVRLRKGHNKHSHGWKY